MAMARAIPTRLSSPNGKVSTSPAGFIGKADGTQNLERPGPACLARNARCQRAGLDVLEGSQAAERQHALKCADKSAAAALMGFQSCNIVAAKPDLAGIHLLETGQNIDERGFARPLGPINPKTSPGLRRKSTPSIARKPWKLTTAPETTRSWRGFIHPRRQRRILAIHWDQSPRLSVRHLLRAHDLDDRSRLAVLDFQKRRSRCMLIWCSA